MTARPHHDYLLDADANSIAMLLEHIPSVEEYFQRNSLGLTTPVATSERAGLGANLGDAARERVRDQPLDYYLERMHNVRARTLEALAQRDDAWLDKVHPFGNAKVANNHWKWFHVLEDELSHRGLEPAVPRRAHDPDRLRVGEIVLRARHLIRRERRVELRRIQELKGAIRRGDHIQEQVGFACKRGYDAMQWFALGDREFEPSAVRIFGSDSTADAA